MTGFYFRQFGSKTILALHNGVIDYIIMFKMFICKTFCDAKITDGTDLFHFTI